MFGMPTKFIPFATFLPFALSFATTLATAQSDNPPARPAAPAVSVPMFPNSTCAIMGKAISTRLFVDIEYGRMYVCCKSCNRKIQRDPHNTYKTAYPATKQVGNTVCPVSGKPIPEKAPTILLQGHEIALCCEKCIPDARQNHQLTLVKATDPDVVDVGNTVCPITSEAADPNTIVRIGNEIVRLAAPSAVAAVQKDPVKALALAKDKTRKAVPAKPKPKPIDDEEDEDMEEEPIEAPKEKPKEKKREGTNAPR